MLSQEEKIARLTKGAKSSDFLQEDNTPYKFLSVVYFL